MKTLAATTVGLALVLSSASFSQGAIITTFSTRTVFSATLVGETVETWDDDAAGTVIPDGGMLDGVIYSTPAADALVTSVFLSLSSPNTLGAVGAGFFAAGESITFAFPMPIIAFGISFNTFATAMGAYLLTNDLGNVAPSFYDPFPFVTTGQFAGFISDTPFSAVTISSPGGFSYNLDDMTYLGAQQAAVPEPSSLALLGSLTLGACLLRRRRQRTAT
jgi:hypothetical protein